MSCRFTLSVFLLVFHSTHGRFLSFPPGFELPEVDGSAVDTCRIFFDPAPITTTTIPITTTTIPITATTTSITTTTTPITTTTTPITNKQDVATTTKTSSSTTTTKKPTVQSPPRKPETRNSGSPVRPQPITDSLLYHLLANSRGHGSLPGLNDFISQPMGVLPLRGYGMTSDSDESAAVLLKRAGRTGGNGWKIGSSSSEDSSDES